MAKVKKVQGYKKKYTKVKAGAEKSAPVVFFTTFDSRDEAHKFARAIVTAKFAACVNVLSHINSFYIWQNQLHEDLEILVMGKTTPSKFARLKAQIKSLHPYALPELIGVNITDGLPEYLNWITTSVK